MSVPGSSYHIEQSIDRELLKVQRENGNNTECDDMIGKEKQMALETISLIPKDTVPI